jgi:outer membrane protein
MHSNTKHRSLLLVAVIAVAFSASGQTPPPVHLTLREAQDLALKNHPQVLAADDVTAATRERITETRSAYYPLLNGEVTGSVANVGSRIGAGLLNDPTLFNHFGQGFLVDQLLTDFGRTKNLVASSRLQSQATEQDGVATRYDVLLQVTRAYFGVLRAVATVKVAQETVSTRQTVFDQISALMNQQLRSQVDVSFAQVSLSEAKLLLIRSQNDLQQAHAQLTRALGAQQPAVYDLTEETLPPGPPMNPESLVMQAMQDRPEIRGLQFSHEAATSFEQAERDLSLPKVTFLGTAGYLPFINQVSTREIPDVYGAAAINIEIPVFNGHLFAARRREAQYETLAVDQRLRNYQQQIARDVRAAWASASSAYELMTVTVELLKQANLALELATGRYTLGLASIVEITQAQLNLTQAQIEDLNAKYDYHAQYAALQYSYGALR